MTLHRWSGMPCGPVVGGFEEMRAEMRADAHAPMPQERDSGDADPARTMRAITARCRLRFYAGLGALEAEALAPPVHPVFAGGPVWPSLRQSWRVVRRPLSALIASDGLSDPCDRLWSAPVALGLGMEVFAEARGELSGARDSWLFDLVCHASRKVAEHGRMRALLERHRAVLLRLETARLPPDWRDTGGRASVLLLAPTTTALAGFDTPYGRVRMAALVLVRPGERVRFLGGHHCGDAVARLAERLAAAAGGHVNDPGRAELPDPEPP